jgi:predicted metal-dependent phosphoesterase TrpH
MIDLHVHSTFSDGTQTPAELVALARKIGLKAIALTDHDSTGGVDAFLDACRGAGGGDAADLLGIPGVEISADIAKGTMHMLGYFVDHRSAELAAVLEEIRDGRRLRNERILKKLCGLGMNLTWEEVASFAGEDVVGRPHFARAMMAKGYVKSKQEAFDRYLAKGQAAYVDRFRLSPADSISAIVRAGGVPALSHPFTLELSPMALRACVEELREAGLQGIEAYYSEHSPEQTRQYLGLANDLGLLAVGGSDYHGEANPEVRLGRGYGSLNVPDALLEPLLARRSRRD